jgi:hypothetical protein
MAVVTPKAIKEWLVKQEYYDYRAQANTIEVMEDPKVPQTFAVQFKDQNRDIGTVQLLFVCGGEEGTPEEILDTCLEDVEFEQWPPQSGRLQIFH